MFEAIKRVASWAKSFPSEQDGLGSSSRLIALGSWAAVVSAFWFHVYINRSLPDNNHMVGLAVLLGAGHAPYVANQVQVAMTEKPNIIVTQAASDEGGGSSHAVGFVHPVDDPDADEQSRGHSCK